MTSTLMETPRHQRVSWVAWARSLPRLAPTDALVVRELALLADDYGVVFVTIEHLVETLGIARSSVFLALRRLEERGILTRERTRVNGRQGPTRMQLLDAQPEHAAERREVVRSAAHAAPVSASTRIVETNNNDGLRALLLDAEIEGWNGAAAAMIARSLAEGASRQFWDAIRRVRDLGDLHLSHDDAKGEIVGIAFEECRLNYRRLVESARPWAMLTTIVTRRVTTVNKVSVDAVSPFEFPEQGTRPGEGDGEDELFVSVEALPKQFGRLIDELTTAGMSPTLALVGTRRIVELAISDSSRRHTLAARDPRLADLGVRPEAAREWMTLVAGSRTGVRKGVIDATEAELAEGVDRLVRLQRAS